MKPLAQMLLTLVLVGAGIAVYDAAVVRTRDAGATTAPLEPEPGAPARAEDAPLFPVLAGTADVSWRATFERRLTELESRADVRPGAPTGPGLPPSEAGPSATGPSKAEAAGEPAPDGAPREEGLAPARPEELRRFRALLEAVERERLTEKAVQQIHEFLDKAGVKLTDDQRRGVVRTTLEHQEKWRQASREPVTDERQRQERREAYAGALAEFERALRAVVPGAEANLIMDGVRRAAQAREKP